MLSIAWSSELKGFNQLICLELCMSHFTHTPSSFPMDNTPPGKAVLLTTPNKLLNQFFCITRMEHMKVQFITGFDRMKFLIHRLERVGCFHYVQAWVSPEPKGGRFGCRTYSCPAGIDWVVHLLILHQAMKMVAKYLHLHSSSVEPRRKKKHWMRWQSK